MAIYVKGDKNIWPLGALYSTKSKTFLDSRKLFSEINPEHVELKKNPRLSMDTSRKTSQSTNDGGYQGSLTANARLAGILEVDVSGSVSGKNYDLNKDGSFKLEVEAQTYHESIKRLGDLKKCYYKADKLKGLDLNTTYVVVAIDWGAKFEISCKEKKQRSFKADNLNVDARAKLNLFIATIEARGGFKSNSSSSLLSDHFEYKLKCDGSDLNLRSCKTLDDLMDRAFELPHEINKKNEGKGTCLQYTLLPLISIYKILDDEFFTLSEEQAEMLIEHVKDLKAEQVKWQNIKRFFDENREFIPLEDKEMIKTSYQKFVNKWNEFETQFLDRLGTTHMRKDVGLQTMNLDEKMKTLISDLDITISKNRKVLLSIRSNEVNNLMSMHESNKNFIDTLKQSGVEYIGIGKSYWMNVKTKAEEACIYYSTLSERGRSKSDQTSAKNYDDFICSARQSSNRGVKYFFLDVDFHSDRAEKSDTIERFSFRSGETYCRVMENERLFRENKNLKNIEENLKKETDANKRLNKDISNKEKEIKNLKETKENSQSKINALNNMTAKLRKEILRKDQELKKCLSEHKIELKKLRETNEKLSTEVNSLNETVRELNKDVSEKEEEIKIVKEANKKLSRETILLNEAFTGLKKYVSEKEEEIETLTETKVKLSTEVNSLNETVRELKKDVSEKEEESKIVKEANNKLSRETILLNEAVTRLKKYVSEKEEEIETLTDSNDNLQVENTILNNTIIELRQDIFSKEQEIENLKNPKLKIVEESGTSHFYKKAVFGCYSSRDFHDRYVPDVDLSLSDQKFRNKIRSLRWIRPEHLNIAVDVEELTEFFRRSMYCGRAYMKIFMLSKHFDEIVEKIKDTNNEVNCHDLQKCVIYFIIHPVADDLCPSYSELISFSILMYHLGMDGTKWNVFTEAATSILNLEADEETKEIKFKDENQSLNVFKFKSDKEVFDQLVTGCFEELTLNLKNVEGRHKAIRSQHGDQMRKIAEIFDGNDPAALLNVLLSSGLGGLGLGEFVLRGFGLSAFVGNFEEQRSILYKDFKDELNSKRTSYEKAVQVTFETIHELWRIVGKVCPDDDETKDKFSSLILIIKRVVHRMVGKFALFPMGILQISHPGEIQSPTKAMEIRQWLDKDVSNVESLTNAVDEMRELLLESIDTLLLLHVSDEDKSQEIEEKIRNFEEMAHKIFENIL